VALQTFRRICAVFLMACLLATPAVADWRDWLPGGDNAGQPVSVTVPYLEWRSGPGEGYPVVFASEQGDQLWLEAQRTGWVRVRDKRGREGWVRVRDLQGTRDVQGQTPELAGADFESFRTRNAEAGILMGEWEGAFLASAYGGWQMTRNLGLEVSASQVLGSLSESRFVTIGLVHQAFPHWRVSPFFSLSTGYIFIDPKASLAEPEEREHSMASAGLGLRVYVAGRYFIRGEVREHRIFTKRETNEEAREWKIGLSVFF
jgi:hypothetical protein